MNMTPPPSPAPVTDADVTIFRDAKRLFPNAPISGQFVDRLLADRARYQERIGELETGLRRIADPDPFESSNVLEVMVPWFRDQARALLGEVPDAK